MITDFVYKHLQQWLINTDGAKRAAPALFRYYTNITRDCPVSYKSLPSNSHLYPCLCIWIGNDDAALVEQLLHVALVRRARNTSGVFLATEQGNRAGKPPRNTRHAVLAAGEAEVEADAVGDNLRWEAVALVLVGDRLFIHGHRIADRDA